MSENLVVIASEVAIQQQELLSSPGIEKEFKVKELFRCIKPYQESIDLLFSTSWNCQQANYSDKLGWFPSNFPNSSE